MQISRVGQATIALVCGLMVSACGMDDPEIQPTGADCECLQLGAWLACGVL